MDAAGDTLYQNFCSVCHGPTGNADGTVSRQIGAPSLLTARARAYSDGYIYSIIRYGRGVMPRYGDKVYAPADRWAIVSHVRKLQAQIAGSSGRARRCRAGPSRPECHGLDFGGAPMSPTIRDRLVQRAVAGRYDLFLGLGGGLTILGLILLRAVAGREAHRPIGPGSSFTSTGFTSPGWPAAAWPSPRYRRSPTPSGRAS